MQVTNNIYSIPDLRKSYFKICGFLVTVYLFALVQNDWNYIYHQLTKILSRGISRQNRVF